MAWKRCVLEGKSGGDQTAAAAALFMVQRVEERETRKV